MGRYQLAHQLLEYILKIMAERNTFCSSYGGCSCDYELRRLEIRVDPVIGRTLGGWISDVFGFWKNPSVARLANWDEYAKGYVDDDGYANEHHYRAVIQLTLSRKACPPAGGPEAWVDDHVPGWLGVFEGDSVQWSPYGKWQSNLFSREPMCVPGEFLSLLTEFPHLLLGAFLREVKEAIPAAHVVNELAESSGQPPTPKAEKTTPDLVPIPWSFRCGEVEISIARGMERPGDDDRGDERMSFKYRRDIAVTNLTETDLLVAVVLDHWLEGPSISDVFDRSFKDRQKTLGPRETMQDELTFTFWRDFYNNCQTERVPKHILVRAGDRIYKAAFDDEKAPSRSSAEQWPPAEVTPTQVNIFPLPDSEESGVEIPPLSTEGKAARMNHGKGHAACTSNNPYDSYDPLMTAPVALFPNPIYSDEEVEVLSHAGATSDMERMGRWSRSESRYLIIKNKSQNWLAAIAVFAYEGQEKGIAVPPGAEGKVWIRIFWQESHIGAGIHTTKAEDPFGTASLVRLEEKEAASWEASTRDLSREEMESLQGQRPFKVFRFDINCCTGNSESKVF